VKEENIQNKESDSVLNVLYFENKKNEKGFYQEEENENLIKK